MDRSVGYEVPLTEEKSVSYPADTNLAGDRRSGWSGAVFAHNGVGRAPQDIASIWMGKAKLSEWLTRVFVPRPPSLVIFPAVAVAVTLFMGLIMGVTAAQVSGDLSGALGGVVLVVGSLPIALLTTIFLSVIFPYRAFASSSIFVSLLSSYSPYVLGALTGIWAALWLGKLLPFEYDSLTTLWRWTIAVIGPRSLSEKQCSKRYTSLVECKDANYSTTKSRLL